MSPAHSQSLQTVAGVENHITPGFEYYADKSADRILIVHEEDYFAVYP